MLEQVDRPITGQQLARKLNEGDIPVHHSSVFRALNQMMLEGVLRRVELTSAYLIGRPATLYLVCRKCGSVVEQDGSGSAAALNRLTSDVGFTASRMILEVTGRCRSCGEGNGAEPGGYHALGQRHGSSSKEG